jgi:phosphoribosylanthranilate isomerase
MQVKICGLTTSEQVKVCIDNGVNFCGFILNYPKSHRFISYEDARTLTNLQKKKTKYVGVLVSPTKNELERFSLLNFDYFQIYGDFSAAEISEIKKKFKKKIIVALQIKGKKDVDDYKKFYKIADIILWDSSGLEKSLSWDFDWIKTVPSDVIRMVAGNINADKLEKLSKIADIVDVSGALETNKVKDIDKIKKFLTQIKKINAKN